MNEKEKMLQGLVYCGDDESLVNERIKAKQICQEFNACDVSETFKQEHILHQLLGKIKGKICIMPTFWCDYGYNIEVGEDFFANHNIVMLDCAKIKFGDNVFIGPNCGFYTAAHPIDYKKRNMKEEFAYPIVVGNNVWIGGGVSVLPGVTIGDNVVIGGGSVVVKDIPSNSLAVGNPCKVIKKI